VISLHELKLICPTTRIARLEIFVEPLNTGMHEFEIDHTPVREGMFIAQTAHESGGFNYVREIASGSAYDVGEKAKRLGNTPEDDDDGERYKGRGLIQLTGTTNYRLCGDALGVDFLAQPELLELPEYAARSACWFWQTNGLNELADKGDFKLITKRINGGYNGYSDRLAYWERAQEALK
jgi:putative chitinase